MELWIVCLFFQPTLPEMYLEISQILCFFVVLLMVRRGVGQRPMCRGCLVDLVETETAVVSDRVDRPMGAWLVDVGQLHVDVVCLLSFLFGV